MTDAMTHQQAVTTFASERYLLDEMSEAERSTFEEHYFSCSECAEEVRLGGLMKEGVRSGLLPHTSAAASPAGDRVMPIRSRRMWYQSPAIPWSVAATLAIVVGYQSLAPARPPQEEPRALTPISLRPATRGQEPVVTIGSSSTAMVLAVDVIATAAEPELSYDLRTAEGARVASGRASAPPSGAPLLLLIPGRAVGVPGHYVLAIGGTEYRFEVRAP
jgi:anti-sigma factor RsiW